MVGISRVHDVQVGVRVGMEPWEEDHGSVSVKGTLFRGALVVPVVASFLASNIFDSGGDNEHVVAFGAARESKRGRA